MSRIVKKVKDAVRCYLLKDLILHNRCPRGISLYYLTSTGSFAFQPTICTLSRSPAIPLLFLQATLPRMPLLWFTIVDHCCEIQAVDKMDSLKKEMRRGHNSPHTYLDKLPQMLYFRSQLSLSAFPFLL